MNLHLSGIEAGSPHGKDKGAVGYFSIIVPVKSREGFVISFPLFIFQEVQLPVNLEDVHCVPNDCERVHGGTDTGKKIFLINIRYRLITFRDELMLKIAFLDSQS